MTTPSITVLPDAADLVAEVCSRLLSRLEELQQTGATPQICLTGGTIADLVHREIARRGTESGVDWSRVIFWWGDERFVASDSEDRNAAQARAAMLDHLPVDPANVHEIPSADDHADAESAAAAYSDLFRSQGSESVDVLMLGLGPDGHVASLFPGDPALDVQDSIAVAVHNSPKPPPDRVTLTFEVINQAKSVWFIVSGATKAEAVAAAHQPGAVTQCPARGVQGLDETVWFVDEAAATG